MLITNHWSASGPIRLRAYHIEYARKTELSAEFLKDLLALAILPTGYNSVPWLRLPTYFNIWKNDSLSTPTDYGTWDVNRDPRDGSANIEVAAMAMAGATTTDFGLEPFTIAHAWLAAGITARICALKGLDTFGSFGTAVEPGTLQNGPIYAVSTHAERAIQTVNWGKPGAGASSEDASKQFGYFLGSGDPDSRWDLAVLDPEYLKQGQTASADNAKSSAAWLRRQAHAIKQQASIDPSGFPGGFWGLDGLDTP